MTKTAALGDDLGVIARDFAAGQAQIVGFAPADAEGFARRSARSAGRSASVTSRRASGMETRSINLPAPGSCAGPRRPSRRRARLRQEGDTGQEWSSALRGEKQRRQYQQDKRGKRQRVAAARIGFPPACGRARPCSCRKR
jgi:hypothetical protein